MPNSKISGLTSATTPLGGTEILPIVQSNITKKITTDDLTVKNIRSNLTTGILQVAGPAIGTTRVMTTPDSNFSVARTDASNSFTGDQTLLTGNLVQGTSSKGFNFTSNTPLSGMTSQLLNWYEEGNWTPNVTSQSGSITSYSSGGTYTRIGRIIIVTAYVTLTNVGTASGLLVISNFPYKNGASTNAGYLQQSGIVRETGITGANYSFFILGNSTTGYIQSLTGSGVTWTNNYQYALSASYYTI